MKNRLTLLTTLAALLFIACKKETGAGASPSPTTTTTTTNTNPIPKDSIPIAAKNSFYFGTITYVPNYTFIGTDASNYTYISATAPSSTGICKIYFKNVPTVSKKYPCVNKPAGILSASECAVEIDISNPAQSWISTSGTVVVTVTGTGATSKVTAFFNKISLKETTTAKIDTASGYLTP